MVGVIVIVVYWLSGLSLNAVCWMLDFTCKPIPRIASKKKKVNEQFNHLQTMGKEEQTFSYGSSGLGDQAMYTPLRSM